MNRIRRVAEELVARYPSLFTSNFDKNKAALSQVSVIHARSIRNQLAGAITRLVQERGPGETAEVQEATLGEKIMAEVEQQAKNPSGDVLREEGTRSDNESKPEERPQTAQ